MMDHLKHMARVRPDGKDHSAAVWAIDEIERLQAVIYKLTQTLTGGGPLVGESGEKPVGWKKDKLNQ